jgi:hypothetical protein
VTVKNTHYASDEYNNSADFVDENNFFHGDLVKDKAADVLGLPSEDDLQVCKTVL